MIQEDNFFSLFFSKNQCIIEKYCFHKVEVYKFYEKGWEVFRIMDF